jgi:DHA1 family inner membrane transport protein
MPASSPSSPISRRSCEIAASPILLLFGGGLVVGNLLGGRLADRAPVPAMLGSLIALALVLLAMGPALHGTWTALVAVALLGAAAFSTVPPLQMWVLSKAQGAGESLASSFNIAAFNLGNALGALAGGLVIDKGPGLDWVTWTAALFPLAALAVAVLAVWLDRRPSPAGKAATLDRRSNAIETRASNLETAR